MHQTATENSEWAETKRVSRMMQPTPTYLLFLAVSLLVNLQFTIVSQNSQNWATLWDFSSKEEESSPGVITQLLPLRLEVPFYVYENETLNWYNSQWLRGGYESYKHSDDLHLLRSALRHPLRTRDPTKARLFFVPTLLNVAASLKQNRTKICVGPSNRTCFSEGARTFYAYANRVLGEQEWFQRYKGKDHVIVASHFRIGQYYGREPDRFPSLRGCNVISREGTRPVPYPGRYSLASGLIGQGCPRKKQKTFDFAMVASLHPELEEFQTRRDICQWLGARNSTGARNATPASVSVCGQGSQCPALAESRYGFHARGDTLGSNRVMDTFLSRTVPLFTDIAQYDLLPPLVPWRNLTYLVSVDTRESFYSSIDSILSRPALEYERVLEEIDRYMPIFDHTTIYRFDAYMAEFAKLQGFQ